MHVINTVVFNLRESENVQKLNNLVNLVFDNFRNVDNVECCVKLIFISKLS